MSVKVIQEMNAKQWNQFLNTKKKISLWAIYKWFWCFFFSYIAFFPFFQKRNLSPETSFLAQTYSKLSCSYLIN